MVRLGSLLGRVQMYRLVSVVLGALALAAVLASLLGALAFPALDLLASLSTVLVSSVVANRVMALLFRVRPHTESSLITALLLFFIFFPTSDSQELLTVALVAAVAVASKYVLAWRGRHVFNPAAIGAVIITLTQLNASVWWVATPALLPFVVIGAALVLYRTRQLPLGVAFIGLATVITVVAQVSFGNAVPEALLYAVGSTPIVFVAGFMLTEPLTLPPRRWQRLGLAAVVAVLFSLPFSVGPVYSSPELALVAGNLLAFFAGQRRGVSLSLSGSKALTPIMTEFTFTSVRPLLFRAGQYLELAIPHQGADRSGSRRVFSISSPPSNPLEVSVGVRLGDSSSSFKRALAALKPGQTVRANLVAGDFLMPRNRERPVLLVAGGIGITPFMSQLEHDAAQNARRDVVLVYAVREASHIAYLEEIRRLGTKVVLLASEPPEELPSGWCYAGSERISAELIEAYVPDARTRASFVSGSPSFVVAVRRALRGIGVKRVTTDAFSGY